MLFVVINDLSLTFVISTLHLDFYRMFVLIFNSTKVLPSGWSNQFRQRAVTIEPSLNYRGCQWQGTSKGYRLLVIALLITIHNSHSGV